MVEGDGWPKNNFEKFVFAMARVPKEVTAPMDSEKKSKNIMKNGEIAKQPS